MVIFSNFLDIFFGSNKLFIGLTCVYSLTK